MFKKILIANRGEIALRVIRACRELGIKAVSIFSSVDRDSLHVRYADEAYFIGEAAPGASYLNFDKIIEVARKSKAEAIHPGYGFLAENSSFAARCEKEGIPFIGPTAEGMALVGDKIAARQTVQKIKGPLIPGMVGASRDIKVFEEKAKVIGYPILVKASMGGGGKGMRVVRSREELAKAIEMGRREAKSAFGDDSVYIEKYIEQPRHVEFQILADHHGTVIHLFERECSIQRRYQKIVEESPSPALDDETRRKMGEAAVKIAKAVGYRNAGTVEFLLDKDKNFYFLEVNARIQVEHPVTEFITGKDLVKAQIMIASGEKLPWKQEEITQNGHAIEVRVYAEDPDNNFMPSPGLVEYVMEPSGTGIRLDSGIFPGFTIPVHYDPIISKLIVWAEDRPACIERMIRALKEYRIVGVKTTIKLLKQIMEDKRFQSGNFSTHFLEGFSMKEEKVDLNKIAAIAALSDRLVPKIHAVEGKSEGVTSMWKLINRKRALR
ncbi:acetyl-CoA carboxylase biotin carboxylase subunit [bacterium]|nr:acetyl-CoA carboxylase biotin carboxylase subunit [bacterium]